MRLQEEIVLHKDQLGVIKENCVSCHLFDKKKLSQQFYQGFIHRQEYIKTILSFRERKMHEGRIKVFNLVCFIFSICLTIFSSGWLVLILLIQYGN